MIFMLVIPAVTFIFNIILTYSTLTRRRSTAANILIWATAWIIVIGGYAVLYRLGVRDWLLFYLLNTAAFGAVWYLYEESLSQKIFLFFGVWGFSTFISTLSNWATFWITLPGLRLPLKILFYVCCYAIFTPIYRKMLGLSIKKMLALFEKGKPVYAALPFISFVLFAAIFGPMTEPTSWRWFVIMLLFEALIIFMYYLLFSHFRAVFDRLRYEDNMKNAERQWRLQNKYYEEMDKGIHIQGKLLHDNRHHLVAIATLAKTGDQSAIEKYIEQLLENYGRTYTKRYCENAIINAVIGGYITIAEQKGITVSTELDLPQAIGIDEYDLCTFFGNTIENAIEACQRIPTASALCERRYIDLRSKVESGRLIVRIENSFQAELKQEQDRLSSSKGAVGGVGLESVKMVVEMYGGSMSYEGQNTVFVLSAVLYPGFSLAMDKKQPA